MNGTTAAVLFGSVVVLALAGTAAYVLTRPVATPAAPSAAPVAAGSSYQVPGMLQGVTNQLVNAGKGALVDLGKDLLGSLFK
ncbi:hypothetical protein [Corallococcus silvisoli]|uniref:hypothetical protein n=1 Tax=Corallococcus silvisoli TaxID=2697031 RepID=UPI001377A451|nr:hypothetical protein [Corallococcus silvisoli]NBD09635.1 hypothetical protein [Corallococcus silvisoli]